MKIPTLNYIHKAIKLLSNPYNRFNLFGSGNGGDKHFKVEDGPNQYFIKTLGEVPILEYDNIVIDRGVSVTAFDPSLGITNTPFYLKVRGVLTVNGHLHMDNMGGTTALDKENFNYSYNAQLNNRWRPVYVIPNAINYIEGSTLPIVKSYEGQDNSCPTSNYSILKSYGQTPTFFNGQVAMTGSGFVWPHTGAESYYTQSVSAISASPKVISPNTGLPGGGGLLVMYYRTLENKGGPIWEDNIPNSPTYGYKFNMNIHCNGSTGIDMAEVPSGGGGMLIIAASDIKVGVFGKITCDAVNTGQGGQFALLNRPPQAGYIFMSGYPQEEYPYNSEGGGGGVCLGYKR